MTLSDSARSELLDALRVGDGTDLLRELAQWALPTIRTAGSRRWMWKAVGLTEGRSARGGFHEQWVSRCKRERRWIRRRVTPPSDGAHFPGTDPPLCGGAMYQMMYRSRLTGWPSRRTCTGSPRHGCRR